MKRLWIAAACALAAAAIGCNRWEDYPYGHPYYPYYQQPYCPPCPPVYQQSATTYAQPSVGPCAPATIRTNPVR